MGRHPDDIVLPPPLPPNGTIGIVAPGAPADVDSLENGISRIESEGFQVRPAGNLRSSHGFTAGSRPERLRELIRLFSDPDVDAIICARGGQGAIHLVSSLVRQLEDVSPKRFIGYSDVTVLQMGLLSRLGWITFSGPMVATEFGTDALTPEAERQFWSALGKAPEKDAFFLEPGRPLSVWHPGEATGPLIGGCLSLVCSLIGTPFFPDPTGCVLLLEEVDEAPYRIDRMLYQIRLAGVFERIDGLVLGNFSHCFDEDGSEEVTLRRLVEDATTGHDVPIIADFPYGHHTPAFRTVPFGAPVHLQTAPPELSLIPDRLNQPDG